jgi:hypothetical protein
MISQAPFERETDPIATSNFSQQLTFAHLKRAHEKVRI